MTFDVGDIIYLKRYIDDYMLIIGFDNYELSIVILNTLTQQSLPPHIVEDHFILVSSILRN